MKTYFDTSAFVAVYSQEQGSEKILSWIESNCGEPLYMSAWNVTEFSAALAFKFVQGFIPEQAKHESLRRFQQAQSTIFDLVPVTTDDFNRAATFANQADLRLRGGDALHLSIAAGRSLSILTLDKRMVAAANTLGIGIVPFD